MQILILGGGGFIGGHLARYHKERGNYVRIVDLKTHEHFRTEDICDEFIQGDLRNPSVVSSAMFAPNQIRKDDGFFDRVYQLAADMGGAGFIFTGENDADIMHNSALINLNVAYEAVEKGVGKLFYSSSACVYPYMGDGSCPESLAYPANPDSEYGWEKLFSERLYKSFEKNYGLNIRIARFHNIFGPYGTYNGGREKAPAALCRKIALANEEIEIWGDGKQTRSFLYIDECINGIEKLMDSDFSDPMNIGSEEMISINDLARMIMNIAGKELKTKNISGPTGVRGRNSNNDLIKSILGWCPSTKLEDGLRPTYDWIKFDIEKSLKRGMSI